MGGIEVTSELNTIGVFPLFGLLGVAIAALTLRHVMRQDFLQSFPGFLQRTELGEAIIPEGFKLVGFHVSK